ncbi:hypothetical protein EXIGLDRAFT_299510 [Exidia glandulosa HHB12029]|uniref:Uncharacterized protein n=1 Tax=Exidia glandulosa HHB12029 TaxID=1314781 RepID=A0A165D9H6_EXIGL|nr:hypothetical protein EXIGLDRAFT_299510 [Exidia glandulosa HHB12029]
MGDVVLDRDLLAFTLDDVAATVLSIEDGPANDDDALAFGLYFDDLGDRLVAFTVAASMRGDNDLLAQIDAAQTLLQGARVLLRRPRDGPPPLRRPPSPPIVPQPVVGRDLSPPLRSRGTSVDSSVCRRSRSPSSAASSRPSTRASSRSPRPTPSPSVRSAFLPDHSLPSSRDVSRAPSPSPPPRTGSPSVDSSVQRRSRSASSLGSSRHSTRALLHSPLQTPSGGSPSSPNYSLPSSSNASRAPSPSRSESSRASAPSSDGYQSLLQCEHECLRGLYD